MNLLKGLILSTLLFLSTPSFAQLELWGVWTNLQEDGTGVVVQLYKNPCQDMNTQMILMLIGVDPNEWSHGVASVKYTDKPEAIYQGCYGKVDGVMHFIDELGEYGELPFDKFTPVTGV